MIEAGSEKTVRPAPGAQTDPTGETGVVFNVQGYSLHDGPGIRTVVFLKGCPLRCVWCCNPESQSFAPEVEFEPRECRGCGRCAAACPLGAVVAGRDVPVESKIDRGRCDSCLACVRACPGEALRAVGERLSVAQVVARVRRVVPFYRRSGGGVTLSGGEPLAQWRFALGLARAFRDENISVALETTGAGSWEALAALLDSVDLVLYDLKQTDEVAHRAATGTGNSLPLANLRRLAERRVPFVLRLPLIPGHSLDAEHLRAAGALAAELGAIEIHLMPFHQLAMAKYARLGRSYALSAATGLRDTASGREQIEWARRLAAGAGVAVLVGG